MNDDFTEIDLGFSLDDSELYDYNGSEDSVIIKIKTWQEKLIEITFFDPILFIDHFFGYTAKFGKKTTKTSLLLEALNDNYKKIPENHPYKLFQFLDLYDKPNLEIICTGYKVKNYLKEGN